MDKNLISVDNLFKQRLGGNEEKEREGAWLQMKDLLDKELPQNKPFGFIRNRAFVYFGVFLLVSTIGITSFEISNRTDLFSNLNLSLKKKLPKTNDQIANSQFSASAISTTMPEYSNSTITNNSKDIHHGTLITKQKDIINTQTESNSEINAYNKNNNYANVSDKANPKTP